MRFVFTGALVLAVLGTAATHADPYADCAQVQPAEARLACFDKATAAAAAKGAETPAPAEVPSVVPPSAPPVAAPSPPPKKKGGALFGIFGSGHENRPAKTETVVPAPVTPPVSSETPAGPPSAAKSDVDKFGATEKTEPKTAPQELKRISAQITSWEYHGYNRHIVVHLDNGQVWRQLNNDYTKFELTKGKTYSATISRGFFGSFDLEIAGFHKMAKVERVQ